MNTIQKILAESTRRRLKQAALERAAALPQGRLTKWINGQGEPTASQIWRIAQVLGVPVDYLLDDAQVEPQTPTLTPDEQAVIRLLRALGLGGDEALRRLVVSTTVDSADAATPPVPQFRPGDEVPFRYAHEAPGPGRTQSERESHGSRRGQDRKSG